MVLLCPSTFVGLLPYLGSASALAPPIAAIESIGASALGPCPPTSNPAKRQASGLVAHRATHEVLVQALGERHPRTHYAAAALGFSLSASGNAGGAEALLGATFSAQTEVVGGEHPDTRQTAEALAALLAQGARVAAVTSKKESTSLPSES